MNKKPLRLFPENQPFFKIGLAIAIGIAIEIGCEKGGVIYFLDHDMGSVSILTPNPIAIPIAFTFEFRKLG